MSMHHEPATGTLRRGLTAGLLALLIAAIVRGVEPDPQASVAQRESAPRKKLIVWGGLDWYSPETVQMNIRTFEQLPFDGTVLSGFKAYKDGKEVFFDWEFFGSQRFEREHLEQTIEMLKSIDFRKFTDNFMRLNVTPGDVDWFDDFDSILHNARLAAQIAKETGLKGWKFDVEDYSSIEHTQFTYKKKKYANEKTFEEYAEQARLRGRELMEAVQEVYPDIVIFLSLAHSYVNRTPHANTRLAELDDYGLLPAFVNGMVEAAGPRVTIIDGQEQAYGYLTPEEYFRGYHSIRQRSLSLVPPPLWDQYRAKVDAGVAIFVNHVLALSNYPGNAATHYMTRQDRLRVLEQDVYYALKTTDEYAWLYSEYISWWKPEDRYATPIGALDAIRSAREKIARDEPLGFDMTDRVAAARAVEKEANPWPSRDSTVTRIATGKPAPKVDGLLGDPVWADVSPLLPFAPLDAEFSSAKATTVAQAAFDDRHLYIAFRCGEPEPDALTARGEKKDDDVAQGDCVEVYLMAGESLPYHFIANPKNVQWDGQGDRPDWNATWQSGARGSSREWTVEIAIPWEAIGGLPTGSIRANLCRRRAATNDITAVVQNLVFPAAGTAR